MFNRTLKYFSIFNNKPPASLVAYITRDFLTCHSCSYYSFMPSVSVSVFRVILVRVFRIRTKYGEIRVICVSPYSVQMQENTDQNDSKYGLFSRSECIFMFCICSHLRWSVKRNAFKDFAKIYRKTSVPESLF